MGREIPGILGVGGWIYQWHGVMVQVVVDVCESEETGIRKRLGGTVSADSLNTCFNADIAVVCVNNSGCEMQFIAHANRMKEIDSVYACDD